MLGIMNCNTKKLKTYTLKEFAFCLVDTNMEKYKTDCSEICMLCVN